MTGVLERRRELLRLMREQTLEKGYFTVNEIAECTSIPRSTTQDWINRLINEKCVILKEEKRGRSPAKYITSTALLQSACRRIFTTVDGNRVAIFHHCLSGGCAGFCRYHHTLAGGVIESAQREGTLLTEYAELGTAPPTDSPEIGLFPSPAVGITAIRRSGDFIVQTIRCIGGPAYSLTDMMGMAEGVEKIEISFEGKEVTGEVYTKAMVHVIIGIDDTDSAEGGATFALALGLLQYLSKLKNVIPIGHRVVMLNPKTDFCTAGNSASFIELAVGKDELLHIRELALRFVEEESYSNEFGFAFKTGFIIAENLRDYADTVRFGTVKENTAEAAANKNGIFLAGKRGRIGALAAVASRGIESEILLNPSENIC